MRIHPRYKRYQVSLIDFRLLWITIVCILVLVLGFECNPSAQSDSLDRHRVPADYMSFYGADWLERAERVEEEQPVKVLETMTLQPGDVVADVGCGSGYYARLIAPLVQPGGKVYCEDIQPEMLEIMQQLAEREGVTGIEPILGTPTDPALPAGVVDWIIITDVYHEMSDPEPMLLRMKEAMSPFGQVALLEYRVEDGTGDQIKSDHAMSVRQVLLEWKAAGFELVALHEFLPSQHLFFFRASTSIAERKSLQDSDLFDAIAKDLVEAYAIGSGKDQVIIRIRNKGSEPLVVTSPVGVYFKSDSEKRDMIARRDGWVVLEDGDWHDWSIRAVSRQEDRDASDYNDQLSILPPSAEPNLEELMYHIQVGTFTVANSPKFYLLRNYDIEQAAVWITDSDLAYKDIETSINGSNLPMQYVAAYAIAFCDLAGVDISNRRVWKDRERIFSRLQDPALNAWFQSQRSTLQR